MRRATAAPPGTARLFRRWSQGWVRFAQRCVLQFVSIPRSSQQPVPGWPGTCYEIVLRLLPATTTPERNCNEPWAYQGQQDAGMEASQATPSAQAIPSDPKRSPAIPGDPRRSQAIPSDPRRSQASAWIGIFPRSTSLCDTYMILCGPVVLHFCSGLSLQPQNAEQFCNMSLASQVPPPTYCSDRLVAQQVRKTIS